jgi:AraC-like DNA-binding protein
MSTLVPLASIGGVEVADYKCTAGPSTPAFEEQHGRYCIAVVRRGFFCYEGSSGSATMAPGRLLLGNPGDAYECSHEHGCGDECTSFECTPEFIDEVAASASLSAWRGRFPSASLPCPLRLDALHSVLLEGLRSHSRMGVEEAAYALVLATLRAAVDVGPMGGPTREEPVSSRDRAYALDGLALIHERLADDLSLGDVAAEVGLSPFHFLRVFRRVHGVTPHQALLQARLRHAVGLLRETSHPVTEVAYGVGFGDLSNFVRTFRRQVGWSPQKFRRAKIAELAG